MKTIDELLSGLRGLGIELWVEDDSLFYRAPRQSLTPDSLAELRERQEEIRDYLGRNRIFTSHFPPISRALRKEALPLSVAQEGFWVLERLIPGNSFSNVFFAFRLTGPLDVAILKQVFDEIIRRHEVLRTTFAIVEGQATQVVSSTMPLDLTVEDLRTLPETEREAAYLQRIFQEAYQPFDMTQGPLLRVTLLRISDEQHLLLLTIHHIVSDAWSLQVLIREVAALYEALIHERPSPLPELSIQYVDYAVWQRGLLQGGVLDGQLSYWMRKLNGGNLPPLYLPTDYPRLASPSFETSRQTIVFPKTVSIMLKKLGHKEGCTFFITLVSVLTIVLSRFTGQEDIRLGTLVASRNHNQIEGMIGLFINTLLLRTDLSGDPTLRVILKRTRETVLEAYDNQDLPFEILLQALEHERLSERDSLFQVLFLFGNTPLPNLKMSDVTLQVLDVGKGMLEANIDLNTVTTFDLIIILTERSEGVTGSLIYKRALFSPTTINRILGHFHDVAEHIATLPDEHLSEILSVLS